MISGRRASTALLATLGVLVLGSCAPTSSSPFVESLLHGGEAAGFLLGLWHGFALLFMFLASLLVDTVGVYEVHNTGWSYDLGFVMGVMMFFSGSGGAASRKDCREE